MTSEAKLEANRQNARKSTGPKTPKGRAVVAKNAMKHGLLSKEVLMAHESKADFLAFARKMQAELSPMSELEELLVDRIISTVWRLRRAIAIETMYFEREKWDEDEEWNMWEKNDGKPLRWNLIKKSHVPLTRYEVQLERSLYKAIRELREIQRNRPTPAMESDLELDAIDP